MLAVVSEPYFAIIDLVVRVCFCVRRVGPAAVGHFVDRFPPMVLEVPFDGKGGNSDHDFSPSVERIQPVWIFLSCFWLPPTTMLPSACHEKSEKA